MSRKMSTTWKPEPNSDPTSTFGYDDSGHHYEANCGDDSVFGFEICDVRGKVAFGQTLRCCDHKTKSSVALKVMINPEQMHNQVRMEDGRNIVKFFDAVYFRFHIRVTLEILSHQMFELGRSRRFRPVETCQMKSATQCILAGLAFMHKQCIVHCDLKPENVLAPSYSPTEVRLIDLGSSCLVGQQRCEYIQSRFYRAPEVMLRIGYGRSMNMWSSGCTVAELMIQ
jgi:dual specificity tyrosine-phosphorylation-regulated kinase 2/3/4